MMMIVMDKDNHNDNNIIVDSCRACLIINTINNNIQYVSLDEPLLLDMYYFCTSLQIPPDDTHTKKICLSCLELLKRLYEFKQQCIKSENALKNIKIEEKYDDKLQLKEEQFEDIDHNPFPSDDRASESSFEIKLNEKSLRNRNITIKKDKTRKKPKSDSSESSFDLKLSRKNQSLLQKQNKDVTIKKEKKEKKPKKTKAKKRPEFYQCEICDKKFPNLYRMNEHKSRAHRPKSVCKICGKEFEKLRSLKSHMKRVHNEESNVCAVCGICVPYLRRHEHRKKHLPRPTEKTFKCEICNKMFTYKNTLKTHQALHKEKTLSCDVCGFMFHNSTRLKKHRTVHDLIKPYQCKICEKRLSTNAYLKIHYRTHTGERPFPCSICDKSFYSKEKLIEHNRTHTGEKPYSCHICLKTFSQQGTRNRHIVQTHNNSESTLIKIIKPKVNLNNVAKNEPS